MTQDDWGTPRGRTKSQAQRAHRNVGIKGHSKLLAVPFNSFVMSVLS